MASRVYKAGTIFSRTKNLLDAGVLATRPLWLDVVEALPPLSLSNHNDAPKPGKPPQINFPTDIDIQKFHKNYEIKSQPKAIALFEMHSKTASSTAKRFVDAQKQHATELKKEQGVELPAIATKEQRVELPKSTAETQLDQGVELPAIATKAETQLDQGVELPAIATKEQRVELPKSTAETQLDQGVELPTIATKEQGVELPVSLNEVEQRKKLPVAESEVKVGPRLSAEEAAMMTLKKESIKVNMKEKRGGKRASVSDELLEFLKDIEEQHGKK